MEYINISLKATFNCGQINFGNMFNISFKHFILNHKQLGPIYLYILDEDKSIMHIKIVNYSIEYDKLKFDCIRFNLKIDSKLLHYFEDYDSKYLFFDPTKKFHSNCHNDECFDCASIINKSVSDGHKILTIMREIKKITTNKTMYDTFEYDDCINKSKTNIQKLSSKLFHKKNIKKHYEKQPQSLIQNIKLRLIQFMINLIPTCILLMLVNYFSKRIIRR